MAVENARTDSPLVSALVSTYNSEGFIRGCIEDLEAQSISDRLEIVVVDSGSREAEREIVEELQRSYDNIRYIRTEERETVYGAWNRAIAASSAPYVTNANTDDRRHADAFEVLVAALEADPSAALVYADCAITETPNVRFEHAPIVGYFRWPEPSTATLLRSPCLGPQPMWRRDLHDRYGLFDAEFEVAGDYDWWLRLVRTERFVHLPEVLGVYLLREQSAERRDPARTEVEVERARLRHWRIGDGELPRALDSYLVVEGGILARSRESLIREQRIWIEDLLALNASLSRKLEARRAWVGALGRRANARRLLQRGLRPRALD